MRIKILRLYKDLLRYGEGLKYTDHTFYKRKVKGSFRTNKSLSDEKEIEFQFKKGLKLLKDQRVL